MILLLFKKVISQNSTRHSITFIFFLDLFVRLIFLDICNNFFIVLLYMTDKKNVLATNYYFFENFSAFFIYVAMSFK